MPSIGHASWQQALLVAWQDPSSATSSGAKKALANERETRADCYQYMRGLDHQLGMVGCPLSRFAGTSMTQPLQAGERRVKFPFVGWPQPLPGCDISDAFRFAVVGVDGKRRWEVPEFANGRRPCLSLCGDQGGSGLPSWLFMLGDLKLRSLLEFDRFHRVNRDWRDACNACGLWGIVLELQVCLNFPFGPWKSESWWATMKEAFESYVHQCGPEDS